MNPPIPHSWANAIGDALGSGLVPTVFAVLAAMFVVAITLSDMAAIPKETWRAAGYRARGLRWAARLGIIVVPLGLIATWFWWFILGPSLHEPVAPGAPHAFTSAIRRTSRVVVAVLAIWGFTAGIFSLINGLTPDPRRVYITPAGIVPQSYIVAHCPNSVVRVDRLDSRAFGADSNMERWDVTPRPGHVDVVLLNLDTGEVVCP